MQNRVGCEVVADRTLGGQLGSRRQGWDPALALDTGFIPGQHATVWACLDLGHQNWWLRSK